MSKWLYAAVFVTGFTALMLCTPATAQDSKLNAPVSRQPTVGSEIDRGQALGFECGTQSLTDLSRFVACVSDAIDVNRQKTTLSEPFEFGLYVRALQHAYIQGIPLNGDGSLPIWRDRLIKIMASRKLALGDFCKASRVEKCDLAKLNEQTYGSGTAAASPSRTR
jgi:hypothetical protein